MISTELQLAKWNSCEGHRYNKWDHKRNENSL